MKKEIFKRTNENYFFSVPLSIQESSTLFDFSIGEGLSKNAEKRKQEGNGVVRNGTT